MKIIRIDKNNQVNGAGLRCVIWVSGCENHCKNCHNPETWDYNFGYEWNEKYQSILEQQLSSPEISGITLTGGDPMAPRNREDATKFCRQLKKLYPHKTIWVYTGHLYEELNEELLKDIDVLIDGHYDEKQKPGKWRGSINQRVIDVQKSLKQNNIVEYIDFNGKTISENERDN